MTNHFQNYQQRIQDLPAPETSAPVVDVAATPSGDELETSPTSDDLNASSSPYSRQPPRRRQGANDPLDESTDSSGSTPISGDAQRRFKRHFLKRGVFLTASRVLAFSSTLLVVRMVAVAIATATTGLIQKAATLAGSDWMVYGLMHLTSTLALAYSCYAIGRMNFVAEIHPRAEIGQELNPLIVKCGIQAGCCLLSLTTNFYFLLCSADLAIPVSAASLMIFVFVSIIEAEFENCLLRDRTAPGAFLLPQISLFVSSLVLTLFPLRILLQSLR